MEREIWRERERGIQQGRKGEEKSCQCGAELVPGPVRDSLNYQLNK